MAVIQYIGARYVPKIFSNPNGTSDWLSGAAYEPLTIVAYAGNSFTSKKPVPASVGNPAANPEYWAPTGIYSEQVEHLRQEVAAMTDDIETVQSDVDTLQSDVSTLQSDVSTLQSVTAADITDLANFKKRYYRFNSAARKVLFIGDSYAAGWTPDGTYTGWPDRVINLLGLYSPVKRDLGGIGFVNTIDGVNFGNIADDVPDKETITDIVIGGGRNDATHPIANVKTAIATCIEHYRQLFPNAVIHIAMICYSGETGVNCWNPYKAYREGAYEKGAHYISQSELSISSPSQLASDKKHPNNIGLKNIAECIAAGLAYDSYQAMGEGSFTPDASGWSGNGYSKMDGDTLNLIWTQFSGRGLDATITAGSPVVLTIGHHTLPVRFGSMYKFINVNCVIGYKYNNVDYFTNIPAQLKFLLDGTMQLIFKTVAHTGTAWLSGSLNYVDVMAGDACISIWD